MKNKQDNVNKESTLIYESLESKFETDTKLEICSKMQRKKL